MHASELTIYAGCILDEPVRWTSEAKVVPVLCGSLRWRTPRETLIQRMPGTGWMCDDGPKSVLNHCWADLSCIETVLRLTRDWSDSSLIGNAQYRRSWDENALAPSSENVLYVPDPAEFGFSLRQQFENGHPGLPGYEMTMDLAQSGSFPLSHHQLEKAWEQNTFHGCLMARGPKGAYASFMNMLIEDFCQPLWSVYEAEFLRQQGYNQRGIAFIAERLFTAMVLYRDFLELGPIESAPIVFHEQ